MKFRLNSPKFLTFMCYIKGWEKSVYITNTTKKLLMTGSKNINLPSLVSWAMRNTFNEKKQRWETTKKQNFVTGYTNQNFLTI